MAYHEAYWSTVAQLGPVLGLGALWVMYRAGKIGRSFLVYTSSTAAALSIVSALFGLLCLAIESDIIPPVVGASILVFVFILLMALILFGVSPVEFHRLLFGEAVNNYESSRQNTSGGFSRAGASEPPAS